jgi:multidrug transporter EmrE-like cation transporter
MKNKGGFGRIRAYSLPTCPQKVSVMAWLRSPTLIIIATQLLFTTGDLLARSNMRARGFTWAAFFNLSFLAYFLIRQVAMVGQLYVLATVPVGKTIALFSASSIVLVNVLGVLLLGDVLSIRGYIGITLALLAFAVMSTGR